MKTKIIVAIAALLALPECALAQGPGFAIGSNSASASSWMAGAQAGYNWQRGSLVYGLEADISGTDLGTDMHTILPRAPSPPMADTSSRVDWYGTVRGRLGWATGPVMVYGTGGLAYGKVNVNSTLTDIFHPSSPLNSQSSSVKAGWVAGFGVEYLWRPNLIVNLGYQYVDLGTTSLIGSTNLGGPLSQSINARGQFQVVSAGVSWLFPADGPVAVDRPRYSKAPPLVVSEPWKGFYAGGHAGGAWGNRTDGSYLSDPAPSDIRLKRDIALVGRRDDGLGLYSYRYLWSDTVYVGVMAQEVALVHPDAIVRGDLDDYLRVNYGRLGSRLMTLPEWQATSKGDAL
jgi:outer membrane immunogenic protein